MQDLEFRLATSVDRTPIRNMMELYLHDFSEFDGEDLNEHGLFETNALDYYWHEKTYFAYIAMANGNYAGFCLVNDDVIEPTSDYWLAQFFVLRKYRRHGIGRKFASHVFGIHQGVWEAGQHPNNLPALKFWRAVISQYTRNDFREIAMDNNDWQGFVQIFRSAT